MYEIITFEDGVTCEVDYPGVCPHCLQAGNPYMLAASRRPSQENTKKSIISLTFCCTVCDGTYFCVYNETSKNQYTRVSIYPNSKPILNIPSEIKDYFPGFYEIYQQSAIAEASNLNEISGMGYRKAIEFLVKGYLIQKHPEDKISIEKETLGNSIKRIDSPQIKSLSTAATWLGNDQTHFVKKHRNYNTTHLKKFTSALCHHIILEKVTEDAIAFTQKE